MDEARSELAHSSKIIDNKFKTGLDGGNGNGYWFDWLLGKILLQEAGSLIQQVPVNKSSAQIN
jgi:hypothetical protein